MVPEIPTGVTGESGAGEGATCGGDGAGGDGGGGSGRGNGGGSGGGFERPGDFVGPYKLMSVLGEGGFGTVWLAERREPMVQRVALKIIKPGMDSRSVIARFEQERQALAVMDHPNVARVFDGGVTERGRPYFVMEYVHGEPITAFCDRHTYTIRQRLELFIPVCEAVQHAHMKGIIHRDIKPSNVLVSIKDGNAIVKAIDFGIAKAISHTMTDKTIFTETGQLMGTPEYMSPEQAEMGAVDIDTRTDVYSLGVVLYELLVGALPFDAKELRARGYAEIQRMIREVEPPTPSKRLTTIDDKSGAEIARTRQEERHALARLLRSELEWIPLKAMRKDRRERYRGPDDLADDVRAFLEGRALVAGPVSAGYRLRKYVRRHRGPVTAAGAIAIALVLGIGGTTWQMVRANKKAEEATQAATREKAALAKETEARKDAELATEAEREARATIEYNSYIANIQMAGQALNNRQWDRLRQRLDACPAHLRGWEWRWLHAESDSSLLALREGNEWIVSASFSPEGSRVLTVSSDNIVRVCDASTGVDIAEMEGHTDEILSATFSPDGKRVLTASRDGTARVWDALTGASILEQGHRTVDLLSATFSPAGTSVASMSIDGSVHVWDATSGAALLTLAANSHALRSPSFSSDATRIVTSSDDGTVRVWDASTGAILVELVGNTFGDYYPSFSPDGTRIITSSRATARVWDAITGSVLIETSFNRDGVGAASFSVDGKCFLTSSRDGTARVWDAVTGEIIAELRGHTGPVNAATFSPDGTHVLTASWDGTARIWDANLGTMITELRGHTAGVVSASFSSSGLHVVTVSADRTARVWSGTIGATFAQINNIHSEYEYSAFSHDGSRVLAVCSEEAWPVVIDVVAGAVLARLVSCDTNIVAAAFDPDDSRVVTVMEDESVCVWDVSTGTVRTELNGCSGSIAFIAFSPDGDRILTVSDDDARLWDAATGSCLAVCDLRMDRVVGASIGLDAARIITVSAEGCARVWNVSAGGTPVELRGHADAVVSASLSPDEKRIVTASWDASSRIWDTTTCDTLVELKGHTGLVMTALFSPNGTRVVTCSSDRTARVWDAMTGETIAEIREPVDSFSERGSRISSAGFSPDGKRVVTTSDDGTVRMWDATTGAYVAQWKGPSRRLSSVRFSLDGARLLIESPHGHVLDGVSYRDRYAQIKESREADARMRPLVDARVAAGEAVKNVRVSMLDDPTLTERERAAVMWITTEYMEQE